MVATIEAVETLAAGCAVPGISLVAAGACGGGTERVSMSDGLPEKSPSSPISAYFAVIYVLLSPPCWSLSLPIGKKPSAPSQSLAPISNRGPRTRPQSRYQEGNSGLRHESGLRRSSASSEIAGLRSLLPGNVSKYLRTSHSG